MKLLNDSLLLSASDLVGHLNCRHLTHLEVEAAHGRLKRPHYNNPSLELLFERGDIHEKEYVEHLRQTDSNVVRIDGDSISSVQFEQTLDAMRASARTIVQGVLQDGVWRGRTDILQRVDRPSALVPPNWTPTRLPNPMVAVQSKSIMAIIQLYEQSNRARKTVQAAAT